MDSTVFSDDVPAVDSSEFNDGRMYEKEIAEPIGTSQVGNYPAIGSESLDELGEKPVNGVDQDQRDEDEEQDTPELKEYAEFIQGRETEYKRAAAVYKDIMNEPVSSMSKSRESIVKQGTICLLDQPCDIASLPRGVDWKWNRSNSRVKIKDGDRMIEFAKYRSHYSPSNRPEFPTSFKLWVYEISSTDQTYHGTWCEIGFLSNRLDDCNIIRNPKPKRSKRKSTSKYSTAALTQKNAEPNSSPIFQSTECFPVEKSEADEEDNQGDFESFKESTGGQFTVICETDVKTYIPTEIPQLAVMSRDDEKEFLQGKPPQYLRAISKFSDILQLPARKLEDCFSVIVKQGAICRLDSPIDYSKLPRGKKWTWKRRAFLNVNIGGIAVEISKLTAQKLKDVSTSPGLHKLWVFTMTWNNRTSYGTWCETAEGNEVLLGRNAIQTRKSSRKPVNDSPTGSVSPNYHDMEEDYDNTSMDIDNNEPETHQSVIPDVAPLSNYTVLFTDGKSDQKLPADFKRAITMYGEILKQPLVPIEKCLPSLTNDNTFCRIEKFCEPALPLRGKYWNWNQSQGRIFVQFEDGNTNIHLRKYTRTYRKGKLPSPRPPPFKLWAYHITVDGVSYFGTWCEKGVTAEHSIDPPSLSGNVIELPATRRRITVAREDTSTYGAAAFETNLADSGSSDDSLVVPSPDVMDTEGFETQDIEVAEEVPTLVVRESIEDVPMAPTVDEEFIPADEHELEQEINADYEVLDPRGKSLPKSYQKAAKHYVDIMKAPITPMPEGRAKVVTENAVTRLEARCSMASLPRGKDWRWNQSMKSFKVKTKSAIILKITRNTRVYRKGVQPSPRPRTYRLWSFVITANSETMYGTWCEKGFLAPPEDSMDDSCRIRLSMKPPQQKESLTEKTNVNVPTESLSPSKLENMEPEAEVEAEAEPASEPELEQEPEPDQEIESEPESEVEADGEAQEALSMESDSDEFVPKTHEEVIESFDSLFHIVRGDTVRERGTKHITPGYRRALSRYVDILPKEPIDTETSGSQIVAHGSICRLNQPWSISFIPHGSNWKWNGSARAEVRSKDTSKGLSVMVAKYMRLFEKGCAPTPIPAPYKLWFYIITLNNKKIYGSWCESGFDTETEDIQTDAPTQPPIVRRSSRHESSYTEESDEESNEDTVIRINTNYLGESPSPQKGESSHNNTEIVSSHFSEEKSDEDEFVPKRPKTKKREKNIAWFKEKFKVAKVGSKATSLPGSDFRRAIEKYDDILKKPEIDTSENVKLIVTQGSICKLSDPCSVSALPRGENWRWNQTSARTEVFVRGSDIRIEVIKYLRYYKKGTGPDPLPRAYRLWVYTITVGEQKVFGTWCEIGFTNAPEPPASRPKRPKSLTKKQSPVVVHHEDDGYQSGSTTEEEDAYSTFSSLSKVDAEAISAIVEMSVRRSFTAPPATIPVEPVVSFSNAQTSSGIEQIPDTARVDSMDCTYDSVFEKPPTSEQAEIEPMDTTEPIEDDKTSAQNVSNVLENLVDHSIEIETNISEIQCSRCGQSTTFLSTNLEKRICSGCDVALQKPAEIPTKGASDSTMPKIAEKRTRPLEASRPRGRPRKIPRTRESQDDISDCRSLAPSSFVTNTFIQVDVPRRSFSSIDFGPTLPENINPDELYLYGYQIPVEEESIPEAEPIPFENEPTKEKDSNEAPIFSSTDAVVLRCVRRRARPMGRAIEEELLASTDKKSSMIDYAYQELSLERTQRLLELGLVQRLTMELDLCLRIASDCQPKDSPFPVREDILTHPGSCGERRPFLSIRGLQTLLSRNKIPHLLQGDLVHVPFTPEEQLFLIQKLSYSLVSIVNKIQSPVLDIGELKLFRPTINANYRYLPGRSENDCLKWLQSFINQKYYAKNPSRLSDADQKLYKQQEKLHQYNPREPNVLLSTNPTITKHAPYDKLLSLREMNMPRSSFYAKLLREARQKSFSLKYSLTGATSEIIDIKIDPSGRKQLAVASIKTPRELLLFDLETQRCRALEGHTKTVSRIIYSRGGDLLVSASFDKSVRVWETKHATVVHCLQQRTVTEALPDGGTAQVNYPGHRGDVLSLARGNRDFDHIISSSDNQKGLYIWDVYRGALMLELSASAYSDAVWPGPVLEQEFLKGQHPEWLIAGTDNQRPTGPGVVQVWDVSAAKMIHSFADCKRYVSCLQGNVDGRMVICGSRDQNCYLYDVRARTLVTKVQSLLEGHLDVNAVTFSPCGKYFTCSGEDNQTLVFDIRNFRLLHILSHTRPITNQTQQGVTCANWIEGTNLLITGGEDGTNLWDLERASPIVQTYRHHTSSVTCLDQSEYFFVSGGDDTLVNIYGDYSSSLGK